MSPAGTLHFVGGNFLDTSTGIPRQQQVERKDVVQGITLMLSTFDEKNKTLKTLHIQTYPLHAYTLKTPQLLASTNFDVVLGFALDNIKVRVGQKLVDIAIDQIFSTVATF